MKAPFVKINVNNDPNKDLTDMVESFRFSEAMDKDNLIEFTIKEKYSLEMADSTLLEMGNIIAFQFGFMGELVSPVHQGKIVDFDTRYSSRISITVRASDFGMSLKKDTSMKIWNNVKSSDIAKEVAKMYKLKLQVNQTKKVHTSLPQGNKTFFALLKHLAEGETDGNYQFYITGDVLYFKKIDLLKQSSITYTYGEGENVQAFYPKIREFQADKGANETTVIGVSDKNKKVSAEQTNNSTAKSQEGLGDSLLRIYNSVGDHIGNKRTTVEKKTETDWSVNGISAMLGINTGQNIPSPSGDSKHVSDVANKKKKSATMKVLEASLTVIGNPLLKIGDIVTVRGVAKRHAGNYYIHEISHSISGGSSYMTTLQLSKNAIKVKGPADKNLKVNNTTGGEKADTKKEVVVKRIYDGRGVHIGNASTKEEEDLIRKSAKKS